MLHSYFFPLPLSLSPSLFLSCFLPNFRCFCCCRYFVVESDANGSHEYFNCWASFKKNTFSYISERHYHSVLNNSSTNGKLFRRPKTGRIWKMLSPAVNALHCSVYSFIISLGYFHWLGSIPNLSQSIFLASIYVVQWYWFALNYAGISYNGSVFNRSLDRTKYGSKSRGKGKSPDTFFGLIGNFRFLKWWAWNAQWNPRTM